MDKMIGKKEYLNQGMYKGEMEIIKYLGKINSYNSGLNKSQIKEYTALYKKYAEVFLNKLIDNEGGDKYGIINKFLNGNFRVSNSLKTAHGRTEFIRKRGDYSGKLYYEGIALNGLYIKSNKIEYPNEDVILNTIKHEVIHYYCWYNNLAFMDGQEDFENMLLKYGVGSSSSTNNNLVKRNKQNEKLIYYNVAIVFSCPDCSSFFIVKRNKTNKVDIKYICPKCGYKGKFNTGKYLIKTEMRLNKK